MGKESIKVYIGRTARVPLMMFMYPEYAHSVLAGDKEADFQVCLPYAEKEGFTATFLLTESRGCYDGGCRCD